MSEKEQNLENKTDLPTLEEAREAVSRVEEKLRLARKARKGKLESTDPDMVETIVGGQAITTNSLPDGITFTEYPEGVVIATPDPETARRLPTREEIKVAVDKAIAERYARAQANRGKILRSDDQLSSVRFTK